MLIGSRLRQRGVSMIELVMFIVIISIALAGILLVMDTVTGRSADTLIRKQALAVAESLLEEIELQDFANPAGGFTGAATQANRGSFDDVMDYNGFSTAGIFTISGAAIPGLGSYNANVVIAGSALGAIAAASSVFITVTVTDPQNNPVQVSGYRTAY